jgi:hydrophobic/amphiphilic exporter-1 (mainly G- bacteria), HAE1 family
MFISDSAIRKPVITVVAMLTLVVFGIAALTQLDTDEFPDIQPPVVSVLVLYPGASPDAVEREVVDVIEEVIYPHSRRGQRSKKWRLDFVMVARRFLMNWLAPGWPPAT